MGVLYGNVHSRDELWLERLFPGCIGLEMCPEVTWIGTFVPKMHLN